jgi:hypothetical protein
MYQSGHHLKDMMRNAIPACVTIHYFQYHTIYRKSNQNKIEEKLKHYIKDLQSWF